MEEHFGEYVLTYALQGVCTIYLMVSLLETRWPKWITYLLGVGLSTLVFLATGTETDGMQGYLRAPVMLGMQVLTTFILYRGKPLFKLLALASNYALGFVAEMTVSFFVSVVFGYSYTQSIQYPIRLWAMLSSGLLYGALVLLFGAPLRKYVFCKKEVQTLPPRALANFIFFLASQVIAFYFCAMTITVGLHPLTMLLFLLSIAVCLAADGMIYRTLLDVTQNVRLEHKLLELEFTARVREGDYKNLLAAEQSAARYRHDQKNQLAAIASILRSGQADAQAQVLEMLEGMQAALAPNTGEFCANPVANAVAANKMQECADQNIRLHTDLVLPAELPVQNMDLCSVLSNLLDNAIAACLALPEDKREIHLSAFLEGGFLFVKCVNPMPAAPVRKGSGLGLRILQKIAEDYQGELLVQDEDGTFCGLVCLGLTAAD